ncbi:MAG TPA: cobaltochelatase subunit CobN, partial [Symbiobacteriaceae bacterium]|nr:cobaltochelatase subunit CobN [Symbiobacteriaceae bacterium]
MPTLTAILLESQMTGPLRNAAARAGVELDVFLLHDLDEEALRRSVRRADAVFGGVLNLDGPVQRVAAILAEEQPPLVVIFHSQVEALTLTRIGDFDASGPSWREAVAALRQAGAPLPGLLNVFLAALPQVESLLPTGQFQGMRLYARALRLWQDGSVGALTALLQLLTGQSVVPHTPVPLIGLWHPSGGYFTHLREYKTWYGPGERPAVGVILHRRWVAGENAAHFAAVIAKLEAQGLAVYAGFSDLDATHLLEGFFRPAGVECLLNLISFNLVGGHGRPDPARAAALLESFDRPYLCAVPLVLQTLEQWRASRQGLAPHQTVMQVVMPELEGGAEPWVYAGTASGADGVVADAVMAERLARRVRRWIDLRRAPRAERKVAVTIFSMPPDKGSVGSAAYLDVFESLWRLLGRLRGAGYRVELPSGVDELRLLVLGTDGTASVTVADRLPVGEYKRLVPEWPRIARCWGPPPGLVDADGR